MTEPQNATGLMDQIHELKRQLADAEKRGAVNALRSVAAEWTQDGDDETGARRLLTLADAIATGQVTL